MTGTGGLSVPVPASPGRSGFGPQLVLRYDSGAGNGPWGFGWRLPVASVSRKTERGLPQYRDAESSDVFVLSDTEDLVPILGADKLPMVDPVGVPGFVVERYRPRVESAFARIERWTAKADGDVHWRTLSADNVLAVYGRDATSRIADPDDASRVFSWLLCETRDDRGNGVLYRYKRENATGVDVTAPHEQGRGPATARTRTANLYLKDVRYGNRVPLLDDAGHRPVDVPTNAVRDADWMFQVVFDYGEHDAARPRPDDHGDWLCRNDPFSSYRPGFEVRTYRLCQRILMFHHHPEPGVGADTVVRSLELAYRSNRGEPEDRRRGNPIGSFLATVTQQGWMRADAEYVRAALPPLELTYSEAVLGSQVRELDPESRENLPIGVDDLLYRWVDLDGDGLSGVLTEQASAWFYRRNVGDGHLGPTAPLANRPTQAALRSGRQQLLDLAGEGRENLVQLVGEPAGYTARTADAGWDNFAPFRSLPELDWSSPRLMMLDLTGDGRQDLLLADDNVLTWYPSLGKMGFGAARSVTQHWDEDRAPRLVQADRVQSVFLADMSGDGLTDLVRIRNGEACYWPNLGYGRFGPRVVMSGAPRFAEPGRYDPRRLRLADIDGSGCVDLLYLDPTGIRLWSNESGNAFSAPRPLPDLPHLDERCAVQVVDLLGTGTACLVWSSPDPLDAPSPLRYVELMRDGKPHLLTQVTNNVGGRTRIRYAPSTRFFLADRQAGRPWVTRLPFPVHVVEQIEHADLVSRTRLTTGYTYSHGDYDGDEREFRGFGLVTQQDTEAFEDYVAGTLHEDGGQDLAPEVYQPPVTTRTWFHTGAYLGWDRILHQFRQEYYGGTQDTPEPLLPPGMTEREAREAVRALRGRLLRQEVYSFDGSADAGHPYSVVEYGHEVIQLQARATQRHGVFAARVRETLARDHDRDPADPRVTHRLDLEVGPYGNVLRSATVTYGRSTADPALPAEVTREQKRLRIQYGETNYTPDIDRAGPVPAYRLRTPCESRGYEVTGVAPAGTWFTVADLDAKVAGAAGAAGIDYEVLASGTAPQRRLLSRLCTLFRDNALAPLPLGQWDTLGLDYESYQLAFTPGVVTRYYAGKVTDADFAAAGYVHLGGDANWWVPSGTAVYPTDAPARFYVPTGSRDPLGLETLTTFDRYTLLPERTDVTQASWQRITAVNDYRVLGPSMVTDPNGNRTAVRYDALGFVERSAVLGKQGQPSGDTLDDPSSRMEYELFNWRDSGTPNRAHVLTREQHGAANPRWQESYVYSNGSGGVAMIKMQAHPGKVRRVASDGTVTDVDADPRWVGTGREVLNNKGRVVKQYEPFFSTFAGYEDEEAVRAVGVTAIRYYDPVGRNIRADHPDGTYARAEFGTWGRRDWDAADTVRDSAWYADRGSPDPAAEPEPTNARRRAAWLSARHAGTPTLVAVDNLARPQYVVSDYGGGTTASIRSESDLTGRLHATYDQRQRRISSGFTNMVGQAVTAEDAETGRRWMFADVLGNVLRTWDEAGTVWRSTYDPLHRPLGAYVQSAGSAETLATYLVYGDRRPDAAHHNLLGATHQVFDGAGMSRVTGLDLQGNPVGADRVLTRDPTAEPDWTPVAAADDYAAVQTAAAPLLEPAEVWTVATSYDALNRPMQLTLPDGTVLLPTYSEANFLSALRVQPGGTGAFRDVLKGQDYDAAGRRRSARYGNDVHLEYLYDPATFRLTDLLTYREGADPATQALAHLHYTYDAVGNAVQIGDSAQQTHFFRNTVVQPERRYTYDALYHLVRATGREHAGPVNDNQRDHRDLPSIPQVPFDNDAAAVREYTEEYDYDLLGNLLQLRHRFPTQPGVGAGWTRRYQYAYQDDPDDRTNRLTATSQPADPEAGPFSATYGYDGDGHMTRMPHLAELRWNAFGRLSRVDLGTGGTAHYRYDAQGERVRKVIVRPSGERLEWLRLGPVEIYRERQGTAAPHLERRTVHLSDDAGRIAQLDTKTADTGNAEPTTPLNAPLLRYLYSDALGSSVLETDDAGQVISYQEYHPYGTPAYRSATTGPGLHPQRYRFVGTERDEETGLDAMGARYYASWLGRWTSADPAGFADGPNRYAYCRNTPLMQKDPTGTQAVSATSSVVPLTPENRYLLDPARYAEAKAYLEASYSSIIPAERHLRFVIDSMHHTARRGWIIDKSHTEPLPADTGTVPPTPDAEAGTTMPPGDTTARPDASTTPPTAVSPTGSTTGTTTGTADTGATPPNTGTPPPANLPGGGTAGGTGTRPRTGTAPGAGGGSNSGGGQPRERTFWDRGGRTLLLGLGILALGLLTVATGGGALVMFSAGMAIGAGAATALGSAALLTASYTGHTTAEEDARWQGALSDAAMVASSPGSALGGAIGYAANGREGMRTGALIGGLAEGAISLGVGAARWAGMRPGAGLNPAPLGEVTLAQWRQMSAAQRSLYELGQTTVRSGVWEQIIAKGIAGNPIAKGEFLLQTFGSRFQVFVRAWAPFTLARTASTGGTPMAAYAGSWLVNALRAGTSTGAAQTTAFTPQPGH
ncbi:SpvB/TcaC N-terminal domain-containing protein [Streptomyces sp. NPDC057620]|uniref:SpvB/TcaC N-terminal domain-containing protein n=1 Tax=Streptomyces sp. NPDC057620 TaxID=3346185 RepID=UPI0036AA482F